VGFVDHAKVLLRALLIRIALLLAGCAAFIIGILINLNAGNAILAGLFLPHSPFAIVVSVARLAVPAAGLWLIYRALR
jgi:hypothetical protein